MGRIIVGTILILWGLSAFLGFSLFRFFFALIIIMIGVRILTGRRHWAGLGTVAASTEDYLNEVAVFSPINKVVRSQNFKGGKLAMVFGGGEIDLREAKATTPSIDLNVTAVFGGAKLIVPKNWKVNSQGTAVVGGYDVKSQSTDGATTLNLRGSVIFGGIEVVN